MLILKINLEANLSTVNCFESQRCQDAVTCFHNKEMLREPLILLDYP